MSAIWFHRKQWHVTVLLQNRHLIRAEKVFTAQTGSAHAPPNISENFETLRKRFSPCWKQKNWQIYVRIIKVEVRHGLYRCSSTPVTWIERVRGENVVHYNWKVEKSHGATKTLSLFRNVLVLMVLWCLCKTNKWRSSNNTNPLSIYDHSRGLPIGPGGWSDGYGGEIYIWYG
jgi:hypothetical protein